MFVTLLNRFRYHIHVSQKPTSCSPCVLMCVFKSVRFVFQMQQSSLIHSLAILFIFLRLLVPLNGYPIIGEHVYNKATTVVPITPSSLASTMSLSHETAPSPSTTKPMSQSIISSSTKAVDFKSSSPATTSAAATETPSTSQLAAPSADSTSPVVTDSMFEQLMMMKNPRGKCK